jgi:CheY-like chemotaxis protein
MAEKILIVDDDLETLRLVGLMLQRQGYEISTASNGELGLEKAWAEKPDLILLDIHMPGINGFEVFKIMKSEPLIKDIPIIALTVYSMMGNKNGILRAGFDDCIEKPIILKEFVKFIIEHL